MIHNFNTRRNNWPKQSLAKVHFQQRFQPLSEAEQIEKYPPRGYCDIFRITCLRKAADIPLNVSEKPRTSQLWPTRNCLSATARGDGSTAAAPRQTSLMAALVACTHTSLEAKWRDGGFPNDKTVDLQRDETKSKGNTVAFAALQKLLFCSLLDEEGEPH